MEDNQELNNTPEEGYIPRPAWQVWGARVGLVLFLLLVALQIWQLAGGAL